MTGSARIGNVAIQFLRRFTEGGEKMLAQFKDKYAARHAGHLGCQTRCQLAILIQF
jgi:hypothetical protein